MKISILLASFLLLFGSAQAQSDWTQWGGPNRDFVINSKGLAATWPATGPKQLWSRPLGAGHSAILASGNTLYTMYGVGEQEVVIALAADTGKTIWEHKYASPQCGHELRIRHRPTFHAAAGRGSALHRRRHRQTLRAGQEDRQSRMVSRSLERFRRQEDGSRLLVQSYCLQKHDHTHTRRPGTNTDRVQPERRQCRLEEPDTRHVALFADHRQRRWPGPTDVFLGKVVAGLDPNNGNLIWTHPHVTEWGLNISMPVWGKDNLLFISSAYSGGSRVLKLTQKDGKMTVEEVWASRRMRLHHGTAIRIGDYVYGSSGDFGPAFFAAVNVKTGEIAYQDRTFPKSNLVLAGERLIILDEDGNLALATATPTELKVISKVSVLKNLAWTVPTLVGTKLYLRDRRTIAALDLS